MAALIFGNFLANFFMTPSREASRSLRERFTSMAACRTSSVNFCSVGLSSSCVPKTSSAAA